MASIRRKASIPSELAPEAGLKVMNLTNLPRRNNDLFLLEYLQEQHSYREYYAKEGSAEIVSWNKLESPILTLPTDHSITRGESLLRTPILRARTDACHSKETTITDELVRKIEDPRNSNAVADKGRVIRQVQNSPNNSSTSPEIPPTLKRKKAGLRTTPPKTGLERGKKRNPDEIMVSDDERLQRRHSPYVMRCMR